MGEVWFEVSEEPCGAVFVLTLYLSDKKFVTTVLCDKIDHIIVFQKVCSLSWKHCIH